MDALFADIGELTLSVDETIAVGLPKLAVVGFGGIERFIEMLRWILLSEI